MTHDAEHLFTGLSSVITFGDMSGQIFCPFSNRVHFLIVHFLIVSYDF